MFYTVCIPIRLGSSVGFLFRRGVNGGVRASNNTEHCIGFGHWRIVVRGSFFYHSIGALYPLRSVLVTLTALLFTSCFTDQLRWQEALRRIIEMGLIPRTSSTLGEMSFILVPRYTKYDFTTLILICVDN